MKARNDDLISDRQVSPVTAWLGSLSDVPAGGRDLRQAAGAPWGGQPGERRGETVYRILTTLAEAARKQPAARREDPGR